MASAPTFRFVKPSFSELTLRPSLEAQTVALNYRKGLLPAWRVKVPATVREEAKARVVQKGGDPGDPHAG